MSAKTILLTAFALILIPAAAAAQSPPVVTEVDPGIGVAVDLTRSVRLDFFTGTERSEELSSVKWKASAGASFRVKPLFKHFLDELDSDKQHVLVLGAVYEYSRAAESGATTN